MRTPFLLVSRARLVSLLTAIALTAALAAPARGPTGPAAVFVTWQNDPTTTVSIDWHLPAGTDIESIQVRPLGKRRWTSHQGELLPFPFSTRLVRRVQLQGLQPAATYELRIGGSPTYRYRTLPATLSRPLRFATGGDTHADEARFGPMNRVVAARDVDFVVFGGDLAYSNGDPRLVEREQVWFETLTRTLITRERRLIPVIAGIGNHEVFAHPDTSAAVALLTRATGVKRGDAPFYSVLHAGAKAPYYRTIDVGGYLSLVLLNSGHGADISGEQTDWLRRVLRDRVEVPHLFPVYHVPGYPSVRSFDGATSQKVRASWAPLFDEFGVQVVLENHDHAYKRTHPIRDGRRSAGGTVYIGDGSWGAEPREVGRDQPQAAWYLEKAISINHGIIVTLDDSTARFEAVDTSGTVVDRHVARAHRGFHLPDGGARSRSH